MVEVLFVNHVPIVGGHWDRLQWVFFSYLGRYPGVPFIRAEGVRFC